MHICLLFSNEMFPRAYALTPTAHQNNLMSSAEKVAATLTGHSMVLDRSMERPDEKPTVWLILSSGHGLLSSRLVVATSAS